MRHSYPLQSMVLIIRSIIEYDAGNRQAGLYLPDSEEQQSGSESAFLRK